MHVRIFSTGKKQIIESDLRTFVITGTRETSEGLVVEFYVKSSSGEVVPADTVTNGIEEVWFHSFIFTNIMYLQMLNKCAF